MVFITDGKSNDQDLKICEGIKCLQDPLDGINSYAIGIIIMPSFVPMQTLLVYCITYQSERKGLPIVTM